MLTSNGQHKTAEVHTPVGTNRSTHSVITYGVGARRNSIVVPSPTSMRCVVQAIVTMG